MKIRILGAGLGGLALARELLPQGYTPEVFDSGAPGATDHALGLVNPMNFRNYHGTLPPHQLKSLRDWYDPFTRSITLVHRFTSEDQEKLWHRRIPEIPYKWSFVPWRPGTLDWDMKWGAVKIEGAFQVLWPEYKASVIHDLGGSYHLETWGDWGPAPGITLAAPGWSPQVQDRLPGLAWKCAQGEYLRLRIPDLEGALPVDWALHDEFLLLQEQPGVFRWGSTYQWDLLDGIPRNRETLVQAFKKLWQGSFEILDHQAGIRPILANRKPRWVETSPGNTWALVGLGARGFTQVKPLIQEAMDLVTRLSRP